MSFSEMFLFFKLAVFQKTLEPLKITIQLSPQCVQNRLMFPQRGTDVKTQKTYFEQ